MDRGFEQFNLSGELTETLALLEYHRPTEIQRRVIPAALQGKHIIAKSQTGTGKTAAFAVPLCELADWAENAPQALVLEPTRELTVQVRDEIFRIGRKKRLKVPAVFGGFPIDKQIRTLKQKSHIVTGTPGRILDHIRRDSLKLDKIRHLVIDEADLMLDMGFLEDVREIIALLPESCRILLFSATLSPAVLTLMAERTKDAETIIQESDTETVASVEQLLYETTQERKFDDFIKVLIHENPDSCIIFCGTKEMVNVLYQKLHRLKISCGMLHGDMEQRERLKMIDAFRMKRIRFITATDVAARGIDVDNVSHVINYDFPTGKETYVHRIGRTGRNGKTGRAISMLCENEERMRQAVEAYIAKAIPSQPLPEINHQDEADFKNKQRAVQPAAKRKGEALNRDIIRLSVGGGKKSKIRTVDIVGTICNIETVTPDDIGIIDIRDSLTYVEILNNKGRLVLDALQDKPIKGKLRKVRQTRNTT